MNSTHLLAFIVAACLAIVFCLYFAFAGYGSQQSVKLQQKINPNNASLESLMRLPGIGRSKAKAIIHYREKFGQTDAFKDCNDLKNVEGIGPKVAAEMCQYLEFEGK